MNRMALLLFVLLPWICMASVEADSLAIEAAVASIQGQDRLDYLEKEILSSRRNNPRRAMSAAHIALKLARKKGDKSAANKALLSLGVTHYFMGEYHQALRYYKEALRGSEETGNEEQIANSLNNIGIIYFVWGEPDQALEYYLRALGLRLKADDPSGIAKCYNNIAGVHHTTGRFAKALENYEGALVLYRQIGNQVYEASTMNNIGLIMDAQGNFTEATIQFQQSLVLDRENNDRAGEALSLNNLGMIEAKQGNFGKACHLLQNALELRRDLDDRQGESVSLHLLGSILVEEGNVEEGIKLLNQALAMARELEIPELIRDDLLTLSQALEDNGDFKQSLEFYQEYKVTHDQIFDEERAYQMAAAETRFDVSLKDQEIANLKRKAEFEAFRRQMALVGAGVLLLIMLLLWNRYRRQKKTNFEIREKNQALGLAHSKLEKAAREELAHVARVATMGELTAAFAHELHQPLTAIKANARATRNFIERSADTGEIIEALLDIADDAERAREIIHRLREMMRKGEERRENHSLNVLILSAIKFLESTTREQKVNIRLELAEDLPEIPCDHIQLQQVIMNLIQNGLAAMKYGGTDLVITTEALETESIIIQVRDSGPEVSREVLAEMFDPFFTTKDDGLGMGLPICRSIVEAHQGKLGVEQNDGGGLTVSVTLPV